MMDDIISYGIGLCVLSVAAAGAVFLIASIIRYLLLGACYA